MAPDFRCVMLTRLVGKSFFLHSLNQTINLTIHNDHIIVCILSAGRVPIGQYSLVTPATLHDKGPKNRTLPELSEPTTARKVLNRQTLDTVTLNEPRCLTVVNDLRICPQLGHFVWDGKIVA